MLQIVIEVKFLLLYIQENTSSNIDDTLVNTQLTRLDLVRVVGTDPRRPSSP